MDIDKDMIKEALEFYDIDDKEYLNKCYQCIEFMNDNLKLKLKVKEIYDILYKNEKNKIDKLWEIKNLEELFGKTYHPFITNILLLSGYEIHLINMKKYKLDTEQCCIHKRRVKEALTNDIYQRHYDGIRISQMLWGSYFINLRLIEVGRLQYELVDLNPITKKEELCIKIHIPSGTKLDNYNVKQSLSKSADAIKKYFDLYNAKYYCCSWLLSNQVRKLVENNSNIAKFHDMFDIIEGEECTQDILNFVYSLREYSAYENLPEDTSLQMKIKQYLLDGKNIKIGIGILK